MQTIRYGITKNLGNYESVKLDREIEIEPGETPEAALSRVKAWIKQELGILAEEEKEKAEMLAAEAKHKLEEKERELIKVEAKLLAFEDRIAELGEKWKEAVRILQAHGVEVLEVFPVVEDSPVTVTASDSGDDGDDDDLLY